MVPGTGKRSIGARPSAVSVCQRFTEELSKKGKEAASTSGSYKRQPPGQETFYYLLKKLYLIDFSLSLHRVSLLQLLLE